MTQKVGGIEFDVDVDVSGVSAATTTVRDDLSDLTSSFSKVDSATSKTSDELKKLVTSLQTSGKKVAANGKVYDAFGMEVKQATAELDRLSKEALDAGNAAAKSGGKLGSLGKNAGAAGVQVQQFVGQIQGGQSALLALSQQGADLGIVLGRAGLGAAVGIGATALSFLIPALTGAGSEVTDLKERIEELGDEIELTSNQIKFLANENSNAMNEMSQSNVELAEKLKKAREELERMQSAGTGIDTGQFAVPRSAAENQARYSEAIKETKERIDALTTEIDTNNQEMQKLSTETANLGKSAEEAESKSDSLTGSLQAQVIALESGAQAAEVYAATQAAVTNGTQEQLPQIIELINRKYELKAAQDAATQAAKAEIEQQKAYSSILDEIFAKEAMREAQKAKDKESATGTLEAFKQSLLTEEQLRAEAYIKELEQFKAAAETLGLTKDEIRELEKQKAQQHADELIAIEAGRLKAESDLEEAKNREKLSSASTMFGNLSNLMNTESRKMFEIGKVAATAQAVIDGIAAVQGAYKVGNGIGGPPLGAAFAAAAAAGALANVKQIQSTQYGSASTGQSYSNGVVANNTTSTDSSSSGTSKTYSLNFTGNEPVNAQELADILNEAAADGVVFKLGS